MIGQQAYVQLHQQTIGGCYQAMNVTVKVFHEMLLGKFDSLVNVELFQQSSGGVFRDGFSSTTKMQFCLQAYVQSWHPRAISQFL